LSFSASSPPSLSKTISFESERKEHEAEGRRQAKRKELEMKLYIVHEESLYNMYFFSARIT